MYIGLHVKYLLFLSFFNKLEFSQDFPKILKYQISRKFIQWKPNCSMLIARQINMTMLIAAFHNFENVPTDIWKFTSWQAAPGTGHCTPEGQPHYLMHWGLGGLDMVLAKMFLPLLEVKLQSPTTVILQ